MDLRLGVRQERPLIIEESNNYFYVVVIKAFLSLLRGSNLAEPMRKRELKCGVFLLAVYRKNGIAREFLEL